MRVRRLLGLLAVVLAGAGIVVCVAGIRFAWRVRSDWTVQGVEQLGAIEEGLGLITDISGKAKNGLSKARSKIASLDKTVSHLTEALEKKEPIQTTIVAGVENELVEACQEAEGWIRSILQTAETARTTLALFSALPGTSEEAKNRNAGLRRAVDIINQTTPYLKELAQFLADLRENKDLPGNLERLSKLLSVLDGKLALVQTDVREFDDKITTWQNAVSLARSELPEWMHLAVWTVTLVLGWFALAQVSLFLHGLALIRSVEKRM